MTRSTPVANRASPSPESFRSQVRDFIDREVVLHYGEWEESGDLPRELFRRAGDAGLLGTVVPREFGGAGLDFQFSVILAEELARSGAVSVAVSFLIISNTVLPLIARCTSPVLQERFVGRIARGELIAGLAVTEPDGGSDLKTGVKCILESDHDDWIVTGEKMFVTNGPIADVVAVLGRCADRSGALGMSLVLVPTSTSGCTVVRKFDKLGVNASPTGWLRFDGCRVPKTFTIGAPGQGFLSFAKAIAEERLLLAAASVMYARRCLALTERRMRSCAARWNLSTREQLFAMDADLESSHAFLRHAVGRAVAEGVRPADAYVAKFAICERVQQIVRQCADLHGDQLRDADAWLTRAVLDSRVLSVFAGASETMRDGFSHELWREIQAVALGEGSGHGDAEVAQ